MSEKYLVSKQGEPPIGFRLAQLEFYLTNNGVVVNPIMVGEVRFAKEVAVALNEYDALRARVRKLEAALAKCDPLIMPDNRNWLECVICGEEVMEGWSHDPSCLWRQVKEMTK